MAVESEHDCIHYRPIVPASKLNWIQILPEAGADIRHNQPLKRLNHNGQKCHQSVVVEARYLAFREHWYYGCSSKAGADRVS